MSIQPEVSAAQHHITPELPSAPVVSRGNSLEAANGVGTKTLPTADEPDHQKALAAAEQAVWEASTISSNHVTNLFSRPPKASTA